MTITSFTVGRLSATKQDTPSIIRKVHKCIILCIQESYRRPQQIRPNMPQMKLINDIPHEQYSSTLLIRSETYEYQDVQ